MATAYTKPFLTVPQQVALLQSRGLDVGPQNNAEVLLTQFGYYRLSGYWHPLRQSHYDLTARNVVYGDDFKPGTSLAQAISIAEFDRRLRALFLEAIERLEIGVRVRLALLIGGRGALAHRDGNLYHASFNSTVDPTGATSFASWLNRIDEHEMRSKEQFAVHLREKYGLPFPLWVSIEVWDFGMLSRSIGGMMIADQMALSTPLGVSRIQVFPSWLRAINHVRNICAHHSRLWNRSPSDQPMPPRTGEIPMLDHLASDQFAHVRLYAVAATMQFLLRQIDPAFSIKWSDALKTHFGTFPSIPDVSVGQSGFPTNWHTIPLWN